MCSPLSAELLWEIERSAAPIGGGPGSKHPVRLAFDTDEIEDPIYWEHQVSLADVGQVIHADAAIVASFEQILTKPGAFTFSIGILSATGDSGSNNRIEATSALPGDGYTTTRHAPLLYANLFGYDLTGITHVLDTLTYEPIGFTGEYRARGHGTFRIYGERTPSLPGDFSVSGEVDAADYVLWRKLHRQAVQLPNESGIVPNSVDIEDYWHWKANFGKSLPSIGSSDTTSKAVPEAGTCVLVFLAITILRTAPRLL
jgi:hypothetical protein